MRRRAAWMIAAAAVGSGCSGAKSVTVSTAPQSPAAASLEVIRVSRSCGLDMATSAKVCDPDGTTTIEGGESPAVGKLFAVIDDRGYAGLVRVTERLDCDDGDYPSVFRAARVTGRDPPLDSRAVAVGPVNGPLERASYRIASDPHPAGDDLSPDWHPLVQIDLDGDGVIDLEQVRRCSHTVAAGCLDGRACDASCLATRAVRTAGASVMHARCSHWVRDAVDCHDPAVPD